MSQSIAAQQKPATAVAKVPPNQSPPALAFGRELLGQLTDGGVVLWDTKRCAKLKKLSAKTPRGISGLADGSLVYVEVPEPATVKATHVTGSGARKSFPATMRTPQDENFRVLPGAAADAFFMLTPGTPPSLYAARLALSDGELDVPDILHPPAGVERTLTALADGELLFVDGPRLRSPRENGRQIALPKEVGVPIHLAPGADKDHVFAATADGVIHLLELRGDSAQEKTRIETGGRVYAMDGAAGRVAALTVDDSRSQALQFAIVAYAADGKQLLHEDVKWLPQRPPVAPISVRLSAGGHLAIGDAQRLAVWDVTSKKLCIHDGIPKG